MLMLMTGRKAIPGTWTNPAANLQTGIPASSLELECDDETIVSPRSQQRYCRRRPAVLPAELSFYGSILHKQGSRVLQRVSAMRIEGLCHVVEELGTPQWKKR